MAFASLQEFFAMGGHGVYVWSAWGVTALLLTLCLLQARLERRRLIKTLKRRARREKSRRNDISQGHPRTYSTPSTTPKGHDDA